MGGVFFEKKSGEKPFSLRPAPSSDTRPRPAEGGWGPPENSGTEYLYHYMRQPRSRISQNLFR